MDEHPRQSTLTGLPEQECDRAKACADCNATGAHCTQMINDSLIRAEREHSQMPILRSEYTNLPFGRKFTKYAFGAPLTRSGGRREPPKSAPVAMYRSQS